MKRYNKQILLTHLLELTQSVIDMMDEIMMLPQEILTWKPSPDQWNILECMAHLHYYVEFYNKEIAQCLASFQGNASEHYSPGWLGNYFVNSMIPSPKTKKIKTFKVANFINATLPEKIDEKLKEALITFCELINEAYRADLNSIRCHITMTNFITLKLGDTLRFITYHNTRHFIQMYRLLQQQNYKYQLPNFSFL